jgi:hypothetical protein
MKMILYHSRHKYEIYSFSVDYDENTILTIMRRSLIQFNDLRLVESICVREGVTMEDITKKDSLTIMSKNDSLTLMSDDIKPNLSSGFEP